MDCGCVHAQRQGGQPQAGGKASVSLELALFENNGDGVAQRRESVPAFQQGIQVEL